MDTKHKIIKVEKYNASEFLKITNLLDEGYVIDRVVTPSISQAISLRKPDEVQPKHGLSIYHLIKKD